MRFCGKPQLKNSKVEPFVFQTRNEKVLPGNATIDEVRYKITSDRIIP